MPETVVTACAEIRVSAHGPLICRKGDLPETGARHGCPIERGGISRPEPPGMRDAPAERPIDGVMR